MIQIHGIEMDKYAILRIESGKKIVTDIKLKVFAEVFTVSAGSLL